MTHACPVVVLAHAVALAVVVNHSISLIVKINSSNFDAPMKTNVKFPSEVIYFCFVLTRQAAAAGKERGRSLLMSFQTVVTNASHSIFPPRLNEAIAGWRM